VPVEARLGRSGLFVLHPGLRRAGASGAVGVERMFVGIVRIELHLPGAASLKDKRAVLRSLKERIRQQARAAVAEVDHQDLWQRAALGVAVVSGERRQVGELLQSVRHLADGAPGAEVIDWQEQLL